MHGKLVYISCGLLLLCSCKKFVDIPPPFGQPQTSEVFNTDQSAVAAVAGVYTEMMRTGQSLMNGGQTIYSSLSADELRVTFVNGDYEAFARNEITSDNSIGLARLWGQAYRTIYHTNAVLEGIEGSGSLSDSIRSRLKGEMLVVRAVNYFALLNLFGDVPFQASTNYNTNSRMPRTPSVEVYSRLKAELELAANLLPENYTSAQRVRPNKWAAMALLARVYLYTGEWNKAESAASSVIQSGYYGLPADLLEIFRINSSETIWQLSKENSNTSEAAVFIPGLATQTPGFVLTSPLANAFQVGDKRKACWTKEVTIAGTSFLYPYKYKERVSTPVVEYYVVFRLAEQYLIRAEARTGLGDFDGARNDINVVRHRAGLGSTTASDNRSLLDAIASERQVELFAEWGHRWMDLKRSGRADDVIGALKAPYWQSTDILYPIPRSDIEANPFLVQNPGY